MKKTLLISCGLLVGMSSAAIANNHFREYKYLKKPLNITVYISDITSHNKKATDKDCQFQVKPSYQVYTNKKKYDLGDAMHIEMKKVHFMESHGIITVKGRGDWYGISPTDGKPFKDPTYFVGTGLKGSGEISGVIRDNYCQAKFRGAFTN